MTRPTPQRRNVIVGTAGVALGVPLLAACSGDDTTATDPAGGDTSSGGGASSSEAGQALAKTSDVPVGGCWVVAASKVVVTQPSEGDFRAFTSTCPHQGCQVVNGTDGVIPCTCHNSEFSLEDGSVLDGPAARGLDPVEITVEGDSITVA